MVAGEVLWEGEAGQLSQPTNAGKLNQRCDNLTVLPALAALNALTVFSEDLKKYDLLTYLLTL